jgi:threonine dehydratase
MPVTLADIALARYRLAPYLQPTPLEVAPDLHAGAWLKLENCNRTHSFKIRGALNAMLALDSAARERGIVAASSGNHAQAIAYAAQILGLRARIVMSRHTAQRKLVGVARYGGEAILHGESYDEAELEARRLEVAHGLTFISPYNDVDVIAGAGTIGLEILDALPQVEQVVVPVGGGGLVSGIAVAIKSLKPSVEVVGVNASAGPAMVNAFYGTAHADAYDTLADALPGEIEAGSITLTLAHQWVDRVVMVSEESVARAMRWMLSVQGWLVEGGGAVGVAALLDGTLPDDQRTTAVVVSGANVDAGKIAHVLAQ